MFRFINYLPIITQAQNIHEIVWDIDEIAEEKIEGRYFSTLGYPVKLTNASGYMSWPLIDGLYIFIDGIENDGPECQVYADIQLRKLLGLTENIQCNMTTIRWLTNSIQKERIKNGIPIKQSLQKVKIVSKNFNIHDCGTNCQISPYYNDKFTIALDTEVTFWLKEEGEIRSKHRKEIEAKKWKGVNYAR